MLLSLLLLILKLLFLLILFMLLILLLFFFLLFMFLLIILLLMIRWHAEAYLLAVLICIFSGTWPYVKLLTMLLTWFTPKTTISLEWRSWALEWLDILGKWSLLDCYIMVRSASFCCCCCCCCCCCYCHFR